MFTDSSAALQWISAATSRERAEITHIHKYAVHGDGLKLKGGIKKAHLKQQNLLNFPLASGYRSHRVLAKLHCWFASSLHRAWFRFVCIYVNII